MKITGFRINGFKSFADPAEVLIAPGMTGIVGPNGCGKSNVIESFRWSMGETSAKSMRADSMDDVIFGGTDKRAPKGFCEVVTVIDNSDRTAPLEFNDVDVLEVSRRLDRGDGSSYKVNGKPVKAKDVRVLFKDAGLGSSSTALVSQGKVATIISAKPLERKQVLEEAAGVTGLASRRHEADLRLRATEQNLEQAESLEKGLSEQQSSLRRQARQAKFRQEVDDLIRVAEATAYLVRWRLVEARLFKSRKEHEDIEVLIKEAMTRHIRLQVDLEALKAKTAPILKARSDAEMHHALVSAKIDNLRKEFESAKKQLVNLERNIARANGDLVKSRQEIGDSAEEYELLRDELALALDDKEYDVVLIEEANVSLLEAQEIVENIARDLAEKSSVFAGAKVQWQAADKASEDLSRRLDVTRQKVEASKEKCNSITEELKGLVSTDEVLNTLKTKIASADQELEKLLSARTAASEKLVDAEEIKRSTQTTIKVLETELKALSESLLSDGTVLDHVVVQTGYEAAFAAALGSDIEAGIKTDFGKSWMGCAFVGDAIRGTRPIRDYVKAPKELEAALSMIGVIDDDELIDDLIALLKPGQSLVTLSGMRYRWDGFRSPADNVQAENLRRMTRRQQVSIELASLKTQLEEQTAYGKRLSDELNQLKSAEGTARLAVERAYRELDEEKRRLSENEQLRMTLESRLVSLREVISAGEVDVGELEMEVVKSSSEREKLPKLGNLEKELEVIRGSYQNSLRKQEDHRKQVEKAKRDADVRIARIQAIEQKIADFDKRIVQARQHISELEERVVEYAEEQAALQMSLEKYPEDEALEQENLESISELLVESAKSAKACEEDMDKCVHEVRQADEKLAACREERARIVAEIKAGQEAAVELTREIEERLNLSPEKLTAVSGVESESVLPELDVCEGRIQSLHRRRDSIGVVNPLAEEQLKEVEDKLGKANAARDELRQAVRRLRDQIAEFDRERRERLLDAFAAIDTHFRELFTRVFGGGRAFLKLSGSDDPLEAGLEIFVSPPGKNLQSMSLFSGGEQAMTALALIFAAFLIRPAPVCVLDEVDAALDDANIDRLCKLVEELAGEQTRFLVITHRALTMSRCDRLYGVTMAEKGVSRLTTLDMKEAEAYVQARQGSD